MGLSRYLVEGGTIEIESRDRNHALRELVAVLAKSPHIPSEAAFYRSILEREKLISTGIGFGIAIPHAKTPDIGDFCFAIGRSRDGLEYPSIDDEPVHVLVMIGGPDDGQSAYLKLLASIQRFLKKEREAILAAPTAEDIRALVDGY